MPDITPTQIVKDRILPSYGVTRRSLLRFGAKAGKRDIRFGAKTMNAFPGDNIQTFIDQAHAIGGGTIFIKNGTHKLSSNLTLYSNVYLQGENGHTAILDFQTNAYGIVGSGSSAYSTGTVSVTNNSTTVTGSGTTWSTNVVAGMYIMLNGIFYPIAVVGSDTSITISVPYAGVTLSGASYVACVPIDDIQVNNITIKNASTALALTYCSRAVCNDVNGNSNVTGITTTDSSLLTFNVATLTANNAGGSFTRTHYSQFIGCSSIGALAGIGFAVNSCSNFVFQNSFSLNSSGNGFTVTSCSNANFDACSVIENGGKGIEFVSGNSDISISGGAYENNASDGIKLTATTDNLQIIGNSIKDNGGYGINVAASTDDNNNITGNNFSGNSSGAVNDSGTGTLLRGNIGVMDNSTSNISTALGIYGDGSDGAGVADGATALAGATLLSNVYTLTRDVYYTDLTVSTGVTIKPSGYRIFGTGTLTLNGTGTIQGNGNAGASGTEGAPGTGGAGGAALADGYLKGSLAGVSGGNGGSAGNGGANTSNSLGSNGVSGGAGAGGGAGGAGGTITAFLVALKSLFQFASLLDITSTGATIKYDNSASSGSGGGSSTSGGVSTGGGGSGSSGRIIAIYFATITIGASASITANGGVGGDGLACSNGFGSGGGGGGNGGIIVLVYGTLNNSGSITVTGGAGGAAGGGSVPGTAGTTGSAGLLKQFEV